MAETCTAGENELIRIGTKIAARTAAVTEEKIHRAAAALAASQEEYAHNG